jgi:hypothetical protein
MFFKSMTRIMDIFLTKRIQVREENQIKEEDEISTSGSGKH